MTGTDTRPTGGSPTADGPAAGDGTGAPDVAETPARGGRGTAADAARIATFAALIAVLGMPGPLALFGNAVPITFQTLGVMLAGAVLGARRGALAVLTLLALVAAGLPLLAGGRGGLGVFAGPSAGYLAGFVVGAFVVGLLVQRLRRVTFGGVLAASLVGGVAVVYAIGIPVQALVTGVPLGETALLSVMFLPGDVLKALACAGITVGVARAYPAALAHHRREV
ncbi:biotin transporter BioY [Isoptericola dokdonensis]|uniref:Biotin transporter BioY n=1 Tax=Isoptericola dokdonensis DS-3 TaxID=1300344 RepID=A0A168F106_9MICO|nr:biotin transporter BioY [Isoptericola dokdonensis]ANC30757.1 Biotin transporter BioY [Isoptericola dokdonensis DS-3]